MAGGVPSSCVAYLLIALASFSGLVLPNLFNLVIEDKALLDSLIRSNWAFKCYLDGFYFSRLVAYPPRPSAYK